MLPIHRYGTRRLLPAASLHFPRYRSTIKFVGDQTTAQEAVYFHKEGSFQLTSLLIQFMHLVETMFVRLSFSERVSFFTCRRREVCVPVGFLLLVGSSVVKTYGTTIDYN
jgi:hypothetical protein